VRVSRWQTTSVSASANKNKISRSDCNVGDIIAFRVNIAELRTVTDGKDINLFHIVCMATTSLLSAQLLFWVVVLCKSRKTIGEKRSFGWGKLSLRSSNVAKRYACESVRKNQDLIVVDRIDGIREAESCGSFSSTQHDKQVISKASSSARKRFSLGVEYWLS